MHSNAAATAEEPPTGATQPDAGEVRRPATLRTKTAHRFKVAVTNVQEAPGLLVEMALATTSDADAPPPRTRTLVPVVDPTASVVICAYTEDRWDDLCRAVDSVQSQRHPAHEVLVVIDHCPPLLRRAEAELHGVEVLASTGPRGLSGARNTGVAAASGEVIAFLDDDASAGSAWLAELLALYRNPRVIAAGGAIHPRWETSRPSWFPSEFDWVIGCTYRGLPAETSSVRNLIGANMSFRRSVFETVGGFTHGLGRVGATPLGCEETELCLRATAAIPDGVVLYEPDAPVWHRVPRSRATWTYFLRRCLAEGRSKAVVSHLAGSAPALSSERRYVRSVLPRGFGRALVDGLTSPGRLRAAAAIVLGLLFTSYGYLTGPLMEPAPEGGDDTGRGGSLPLRTSVPRARNWQDPRSQARTRRATGTGVAMATAGGLWIWSLFNTDIGAMTDFGLLSVLPLAYWAGMAVLSVSFVLHISRGGSRRMAAAHVLLLVLMLHGTPTLLYSTLRYAWAWKHVGVIDYILRHHDAYIGNGFSAYAGWPGFFSMNATLTGGSGFSSALSYASWGPVVFNLLDLLPIVVIFRTFTSDRRHLWTAVWIYELANWVGQDYFSPQATAYLLYLCVIACCLRWLPDLRRPRKPGAQGATVQSLRRNGVPRPAVAYAVIVVLTVAIVTSHQLTPYVLVAGLAALALTRTRRTGWLAIGTFAFSIVWATVAARAFFEQNPQLAFGSIGSLIGNLFSGLTLAPHPSPTHQLLTSIGRFTCASVWLLAAAGFWRQREHWRERLPLALLAVTPLPMVLTNSYGGEMLLRVYMFGLVPACFFAAALFLPRGEPSRSRHLAPVLLVVVALLGVGFTANNFGSERANYFTPNEVAASRWLLSQPAGTIYGVTENLPWAFENYERYKYHWFDVDDPSSQRALLRDPAAYISTAVAEQGHGEAYVILDRSQNAWVEMTGEMPSDTLDVIARSLSGSSRFTVAYRNPDAIIYRFVGGTP